MKNELIHKIALSMFPRIGAVNARKLVAHLGSLQHVFECNKSDLQEIPGISKQYEKIIIDGRQEVLDKASKEIEFINDNGLQTFFYLDPEFPKRLAQCEDAPTIFYFKGDADLNSAQMISIVGTRNATEYGRRMCLELIEGLAANGHQPIIVSGLAYGIDIAAHKAALKTGFQTIGVVGHGLDTMYPATHRNYAAEIVQQGGLISDFPSKSKIDPGNFLRRNRIIAGLADATIVVESAAKGGALVTADIAHSYDRDLFAFPGRSGDPYSMGCNSLIKSNKAAMIENAEDLIYFLGWNSKKKQAIQTSLFVEISDEERKYLSIFKNRENIGLNEMASELLQPVSKLSSAMLNLEFKGIIQCLPGNVYRLNSKFKL